MLRRSHSYFRNHVARGTTDFIRPRMAEPEARTQFRAGSQWLFLEGMSRSPYGVHRDGELACQGCNCPLLAAPLCNLTGPGSKAGRPLAAGQQNLGPHVQRSAQFRRPSAGQTTVASRFSRLPNSRHQTDIWADVPRPREPCWLSDDGDVAKGREGADPRNSHEKAADVVLSCLRLEPLVQTELARLCLHNQLTARYVVNEMRRESGCFNRVALDRNKLDID
jgi:hypothetical protein